MGSLLHKARGVFTPRPCAFAGKQQVVLDFFEIGWSVIVCSDCSASSQSKQNYLAQRRGGAGLFAMGQYRIIVICGRKLLGRVDLRVDRGHLRNHMTIIRDVPKADDIVGLFRILSGRHGGRPSQEQEATSSPQA